MTEQELAEVRAILEELVETLIVPAMTEQYQASIQGMERTLRDKLDDYATLQRQVEALTLWMKAEVRRKVGKP